MIGENRDLLKALREVSSSDRTNEHDLQDSSRTATSNFKAYCCRCMLAALGQVPAVALIAMFHLMIGIPFGVSYFPIGWREDGTGDLTESGTDDKVHGAFPLPGKESLGIRMFLFATMVGQVCYSLLSGFGGPIGLQMVENVPFTHALAQICIKHQGYGIQALSSSLLLFAVGSIVVGGVFMVLGKFNLGRIVYYFPSHVLVGLIAGIGVYLFKTGIEVTMDAVFTWENITSSLDLLITILLFEVVLRLLDWFLRDAHGNPLYSLLSPIYFCMITPVFYVGLWIFSVDFKVAEEAGYFFPSLTGDADGESLFQNNLFDMWTAIELGSLSWAVLADAIPTLISLTLFSLIHVPINIPALSLSTNTEVDMNVELVAHGYSNMISGLCGGLQNYMVSLDFNGATLNAIAKD
jgi:SulP family sulfate permease